MTVCMSCERANCGLKSGWHCGRCWCCEKKKKSHA